MKVLVIGSGGREHAMAWKLSQSKKVNSVFIAPGNGGTLLNPKFKNINLIDINLLADFAIEEKIDLTVIGPELPLSKGIVDLFRSKHLNIFGPTQKAAQLESSKDYAKDFMYRHSIPTAKYKTFKLPNEAHRYIDMLGAPIVIKADGLASGKGVIFYQFSNYWDDSCQFIDLADSINSWLSRFTTNINNVRTFCNQSSPLLYRIFFREIFPTISK